MREKVNEICQLIPGFELELDRTRGMTLEGKDYCKYIFKNGSYFDTLAARESSRGKRRHAGVIEECVGVDGDILSQVVIPTMNISRRCKDGTIQPDEPLNKSQLFITTAGYKNTFPYNKLIQLLVWSIVRPEKAMVIGGTYRVPVLVKLLDKNFVRDLKMDGEPSVSAVKNFTRNSAGVLRIILKLTGNPKQYNARESRGKLFKKEKNLYRLVSLRNVKIL